jgi:hypothetical protein
MAEDEYEYKPEDAVKFRDECDFYDQENNEEYSRNMRFYLGRQDDDRAGDTANRPRITINKIKTPVNVVVNQARQNLPGPDVSRRDDVDAEDQAEVYEGRIRDYEYRSSASQKYLQALEHSAIGGIGYFGLTFDYVSPISWEQEIAVRAFKNPKLVKFDPNAQERDGCDAKRVQIFKQITQGEYRRCYGLDPEKAHSQFQGTETQRLKWHNETEKTLWICEDWCVRYERDTLYQIGQQGLLASDLKRSGGKLMKVGDRQFAYTPDGSFAVDSSRVVQLPKIYQHLTDGTQELQEAVEWPGKRIPIFRVICTEYDDDGENVRRSLISDGRDAQKLINYIARQKAVAFKNAPTPKWVVGVNTLQGELKKYYADPTDPDVKVLPYVQYDERGNQLPPPVYQQFEPNIQAYLLAEQQLENDLRETCSVNAAFLGEGDVNAPSARAQRQLQQQSGQATSHVFDNWSYAIQASYKEAIEVMRSIETNPRKVRVIGKAGQKKVVQINQHQLPPDQQMPDPKTGQVKFYNMAQGDFDVIASVGRHNDTARDKASEMLIQLLPAMPQLAQMAPDVILKLMRLPPEADEAIDRVTPDQYKDQGQSNPQQDKQRMIQLDQAAQAMHKQIDQLTQVIETKQMEMQNAFKIAELNSMTQLRLTEMKINAEMAMKGVEAQLDREDRDLKIAKEIRLDAQEKMHEQHTQMHEQAHEAGLAALEHTHTVLQQAQTHEHTKEQQEQAAELAPTPNAAD